MNILILEEAEIGLRIPRADRRWAHIKKVLKKGPGDRIAAGLADGPLGEAVLLELDDAGLVLDFEERCESPPLAPLRLILGLPRPIQAARILKELTSLGIEEIHLTVTELGEKSYAQSALFKDRDYRGPLIEGAEQAGNPRLPRVFNHWSLRRCLDAMSSKAVSSPPENRIVLHPYSDAPRMGAAIGSHAALRPPVTLAVGSERGWTDAELAALREAGFVARSLGGRILKTETAALAACVLALAGLRLL
ncbi:MAG: RsmE family RNA methyltransferase [Rectinemataceae bacterium]